MDLCGSCRLSRFCLAYALRHRRWRAQSSTPPTATPSLGQRVEIAPTGASLIGEAAYTGVTDSQGRFRIDNVKDGVYVARYRAPGYLYEGDLTPVRPSKLWRLETPSLWKGA